MLLLLLTLFMPAIFCMNALCYAYRIVFNIRTKRYWRYPRQHSLRQRLFQRPYLTRKKNMSFLRTHYLPALSEHRLWIYKRRGWTFRFLRIKTEEVQQDHPSYVLTKKLSPSPYLRTFVSQFDPTEQYRLIKNLSDPTTLESSLKRKRTKSRLKRPLAPAPLLTQGALDH